MKTIEHVVTLPASPSRVYQALMDSAKHAAFTGAPADVVAQVGGTASAHAGKVTAIFLELVPGERIVQAWRPADFPPGVFTLATYALAPDGAGTKLTFTQQAVPDQAYPHLDAGWHKMYWTPLAAYLEAGKDR